MRRGLFARGLIISVLALAISTQAFAQRFRGRGFNRGSRPVSRSNLQNRWGSADRSNLKTRAGKWEDGKREISSRYGGEGEITRKREEGTVTRETSYTNRHGDEWNREASREWTSGGLETHGKTNTFDGTDLESDALFRKTPGGGVEGWGAVENKDRDTVTYGHSYRKDGKVYSRGAQVKYYDYPVYSYYIPGYPSYYYPYPYPYPNKTTVIVWIPDSTNTGAASTKTKATASPVSVFLSPDEPVYRTKFRPKGLYSEKHEKAHYWVPGALGVDQGIRRSIDWALDNPDNARNGLVIGYNIKHDRVYLTGEPPLRGIYFEHTDNLYAWISGVQKPTSTERDSIKAAIYAHKNGGAEQIAQKLEKKR